MSARERAKNPKGSGGMKMSEVMKATAPSLSIIPCAGALGERNTHIGEKRRKDEEKYADVSSRPHPFAGWAALFAPYLVAGTPKRIIRYRECPGNQPVPKRCMPDAGLPAPKRIIFFPFCIAFILLSPLASLLAIGAAASILRANPTWLLFPFQHGHYGLAYHLSLSVTD
ncbi:hypothetical protein KM043_004302 [Ampulex compressa]|nr:hypothetical protein KM043_004302 [Ampulex compressa]